MTGKFRKFGACNDYPACDFKQSAGFYVSEKGTQSVRLAGNLSGEAADADD